MDQNRANKQGWGLVLDWATFLSIFIAMFFVFIYAPPEKVMGQAQRIFYFHVSSAWLGMLSFLVVFICSILYLIKREQKWDIIAYTSAEIGVIFTSIVLVTGPIWARPTWNTWWTWDIRLTTTLIMWFLYIAYGRIRASLGEEGKRAVYAAVFGIIAFIDVPIVFFSIRYWQNYQNSGIHPIIVKGSSIDLVSDMRPAFFGSLLAFTLLYIFFMRKSVKIEMIKAEVKSIKENLLG